MRASISRAGWRRAIAFLVVLIAGFAAQYGGLTQNVDQALRALVSRGLIDLLPAWATFVVTILALGGWFGRTSWWKSALLACCALAAIGIALLLLRRGEYVPVGSFLLALAFSALARCAYDVVSEGLSIEAARAGARGRLCVLVFDVAGFVPRAEDMPAEQSIALLNACITALTAAVQRRGGTANRLLGAGAVAYFGAAQALDCPEKSALEAAQDILEALRDIDAQLAAHIGVHAGDLAYGQVGGRRRQDYTALGPVVTAAAELQQLAAELDEPVVCSAAVADAVGRAGGLREAGSRTVGGQTLALFAWTPPVLLAADDKAPAMKPA